MNANEQEFCRSLVRGSQIHYLAKVTKVEDRKLSVDGAGGEAQCAPKERILVLGHFRLFSVKRRMTGLACIRVGHVNDLESLAVEGPEGDEVLRLEFRKGYEDRGGFVMTVPWQTPLTSTLARSVWELWLKTGGALEHRRPALEGAKLERLAASSSMDIGTLSELHVYHSSRTFCQSCQPCRAAGGRA